jgi:hypothetical protein
MQAERHTFHWPLEFPEVFARGGFDAIVGNPPFMGGSKLSGVLGDDYRQHLVRSIAGQKRGNADLVAYFVLRACSLARVDSVVGLLATNTIAEGDTREVALDQLLGEDLTIIRANRSRRWPGQAHLQVAQVWLHRGTWPSARTIDGSTVPVITSTLERQGRIIGRPHLLGASGGKAFVGSYAHGAGFLLTPDEACRLIEADQRNRDVLFPYLGGEDLNSQPDQSATRWTIYFWDWPLERAAEYPLCLSILEERVRPYRERHGDPKLSRLWWLYKRPTTNLYLALERLSRAVVIARHSNTAMPVFVEKHQIYSDALVVFSFENDADYGVLASAIHISWAIAHASTIRTDIRYTPSDCFETFPQPESTSQVTQIARALNENRQALMLERNEGLTQTYNRVHDPDERPPDIVQLRRLHQDLDHTAAVSYGWHDLDLDHGFHETPQGIRYTIGPVARVEVLDRLLELNHERYAAEVAAGLHDRKEGGGKRKRSRVAVGDQTTLDGVS